MGVINDLHLLIVLVVFLYIYSKAKMTSESRVIGVVVAAFVAFFIFFQHIGLAFLFFFIMFGYLFLGAFAGGLLEGQMASAYMSYLRAAPPTMFGPQLGPPGAGIGPGWFNNRTIK